MITKTMIIGTTAHMNSGVAEAITVEKREKIISLKHKFYHHVQLCF